MLLSRWEDCVPPGLDSFSQSQWTAQRESGDFVFPEKSDTRMLLRIDDEVLKNFGSCRPAGNPVVSADGHHAASVLRFCIEQVELVS